MRRAAAFLLLACVLSACEDTPQQAKKGEDDGSGGMRGAGASTGGGGGQVAIGGQGEGTIADRYEKALKMIKEKDWDGARDQLLEAYRRSDSADIKKEISGHLKMVEQGLLSQPTLTAPQAFASPALIEKRISMRGLTISGGPVGKVTYYFWLNSGQRIQCRFSGLTLDEKKSILSLPDGSQALVRGTLKPPWGSNPTPYLDLTYFRLEKRAVEPVAAPAQERPVP